MSEQQVQKGKSNPGRFQIAAAALPGMSRVMTSLAGSSGAVGGLSLVLIPPAERREEQGGSCGAVGGLSLAGNTQATARCQVWRFPVPQSEVHRWCCCY